MVDDKHPRIRGRALQAIREEHFRQRPLCARCKANGRVSIAMELDHVVPLFKGGLDSPDPMVNRQGLCNPCHLEKTAEDMGHKATGCDVNGLPTDPRHPWNRKTP